MLPADSWCSLFPAQVRQIILSYPQGVRQTWQEIRLRPGQPVLVLGLAGETWLGPGGLKSGASYVVTDEDLHGTFQLMTKYSMYALEEELRSGFITLPGGHRLGFAGHAVLENGKIKLLRQISSINLRLARAVPSAARIVLPHLLDGGRVLSTLLISPPRCGKTTLLRELVRLISTGLTELGLRGRQVCLVDERSELAGTHLGRPQLDVGPRTDVLDGAPKAEGMLLMLRAMSPDVLATDEIGRPEDAEAIAEAAKAGVAVLATSHAATPAEACRRPILTHLLAGDAYFQRLVALDASRGPGTVRGIYRSGRAGETEAEACCGSWVPCASSPAQAASGI